MLLGIPSKPTGTCRFGLSKLGRKTTVLGIPSRTKESFYPDHNRRMVAKHSTMTPMITTTTIGHSNPHTERVRRHRDGSVLLSIAEDRICKLNGVGALTWMILEEAATALSLDEIVQALEQQFDAINSEGEVRYDVSAEQLQADTSRFLQKMVSLNLLDVSENSYSIKEDVCGTTS